MSTFSLDDIMDELESSVAEQLQPVTYKWLARQYRLSANHAKRILWHFFKQHQDKGVKAVFLVSGVKAGADGSTHIVMDLVESTQLQAFQSNLQPGFSQHVHCILPKVPKAETDIFSHCYEQTTQLFDSLAAPNGATASQPNMLEAATCRMVLSHGCSRSKSAAPTTVTSPKKPASKPSTPAKAQPTVDRPSANESGQVAAATKSGKAAAPAVPAPAKPKPASGKSARNKPSSQKTKTSNTKASSAAADAIEHVATAVQDPVPTVEVIHDTMDLDDIDDDDAVFTTKRKPAERSSKRRALIEEDSKEVSSADGAGAIADTNDSLAAEEQASKRQRLANPTNKASAERESAAAKNAAAAKETGRSGAGAGGAAQSQSAQAVGAGPAVRVYYNDKGEEVTEVVHEPRAALAENTRYQDLGNASGKASKESAAAPPPAKPAANAAGGKAGKRSGSGKGAASGKKAGNQAGIMSFFKKS